MKRNRQKLYCTFLVTTLTFLVSFLSASFVPRILSKAFNTSFSIIFNQNKNKLHSYTDRNAYSGDTTIKTELGNDVGIAFGGVRGISTSWHVLENDGYFTNTTPILGMSSIALSFNTDDVSFSVYWSSTTTFDDEKHQTYISSKSETVTCDFNEYYPSYFKIINDGTNLNISSISIELTCLNNYPILTTYSEDETMGIVSGSSGAIRCETTATIVAVPNQGFSFAGWYSGSLLISDELTYSFTMGTEDITYSARFIPQSYNFVVQSESEAKGTVSDASGSYDYLSTVVIEAIANDGYSFGGWYSNSTLISTNNPYTFTMPYENTTYTAMFTTNSYSLLLTNQSNELGSVSGSGSYLYNSNITVVATPNTGVSFLGWYNIDNEQLALSQEYTFKMPCNDYELIAKFAYTPYSVAITINDSNMGSVIGKGSYIYNQQVNLVAIPVNHHSFIGWYDGETLLSSDTNYTFNMPAKSLNYEAKFTKNYSLRVFSDDESKGTVSSPSDEWGAGMEVTVTAVGNAGYGLHHWEDADYNEVSKHTNYTFLMPEHDVELWAVFGAAYLLTVSTSDETKGVVAGGGYYVVGTNVTVSVDFITGTFKGWYDSSNTLVSKTNPYTFVMPNIDYTLVAYFLTKAEEEELEQKYATKPFVSDDEKILTYGLYPQKNVDDFSLISELNALTTPESNGWYLYGDDYYAKVSATPYQANYTFENGTTIENGAIYWFKCEPIVWDVLSNINGNCYIVSSKILDAYCYYSVNSVRYIDGEKVYPNNYEHSDIRMWLNEEFYDSAFELEDSYIQITTVDNSQKTTSSTINPYVCRNTEDKVFLPSYKDYINSSYGFSTSADPTNTRQCKVTDFARAKGSYCNIDNDYNGSYWTRSPSCGVSSIENSWSNKVISGSYNGSLNPYTLAYSKGGVRPAISVRVA